MKKLIICGYCSTINFLLSRLTSCVSRHSLAKRGWCLNNGPKLVHAFLGPRLCLDFADVFSQVLDKIAVVINLGAELYIHLIAFAIFLGHQKHFDSLPFEADTKLFPLLFNLEVVSGGGENILFDVHLHDLFGCGRLVQVSHQAVAEGVFGRCGPLEGLDQFVIVIMLTSLYTFTKPNFSV